MPDKIENARELLLSQGRRLLLKKGYGGLRVRELTAECGMATGTFYRYFQNKDDLVYQLMDLKWRSVSQTIGEAMKAPLPLRDKLEIAFREISSREQGYHSVFAGTLVLPDRFSSYYLDSLVQMDRLFERMLLAEAESGAIRLPVAFDKAAHIMTRFFISASRDPKIEFDDLWPLMRFQET